MKVTTDPTTKCPDCGCINPSVEHLQKEYLELTKACFGIFGGHAQRAKNQVAHMLLEQGITEIPNIFGPIQIRRGGDEK